jgi:dienelactone hydrolase
LSHPAATISRPGEGLKTLRHAPTTGTICRSVRAAVLLSAVLLAQGAAAAPGKVAVSVSPSDVLVDGSVRVVARGLPPRAPVVLQATARDDAGRLWRSRLDYRADDRGVVDTHFGMRLFWSMVPVDGQRVSSSVFRLPLVGRVTVAVRRAGREVGRARFTRRAAAAGVEVHDYSVADAGFVGTFSAVPSPDPHPAVLAIGGSAGGHGHGPSLTASRGYPTLSLGYFGEPGLPARLQNIPLEYFADALRWLGRQPGVDPARIAVLGVSRGAELGLLLAATYPTLVDGVWACTTSAQVLGGSPSGAAWTLNGAPIPFGPLPVTRITAPVVITGGEDDQIIDSAFAATDLAATARANGQTNVVGRVYPKAGHGAGCRVPNLPIPTEFETAPNTLLATGGTRAANARAAETSWPAFLDFLATLPHR